jgi:hypothetical protein
MPPRTRRQFLADGLALAALAPGLASAANRTPGLERQLGVTTGSFVRHLAESPQPGKLRLLDLPKLMRDELDLRVIDLMTRTLPSFEPAYLERLRVEADRAGCVLTNLKMNQPGLDMASPDEAIRRKSLEEYRRTIEAAALLGVRWVRPLPGSRRPDLKLVAEGFRELIDYAAPKGISLLVENFGWMKDDPEAIPAILKAVGPGLAAQPDTGNWTDEARYRGLELAFPHAVSCDFKFFALGPDGSHAAYDLKRCFDIGWTAGFRGPWCFEHSHQELPELLRGMKRLRDLLRDWMKNP